MLTKVVSLPGKWADLSSTGHPLSAYQALKAGGYVGVILDLETQGWQTDYNNALAAGLGVMLNQGYWGPAWIDPAQAKLRAQYAVQQMRSVQYPLAGTVFLDCESMMALTPTAVLNWMNAWDAEVHANGYTALGKYEGSGVPLTGQQWYSDLALTAHYWKSGSAVPMVAVRGYQVVQTRMTHLFDGVAIDDDEVGPDRLGGQAMAVVAPNAVPAPVITTSTDWQPAVAALKQTVSDQATLIAKQNAALTTATATIATLQRQLTNAGKALQG